MRRAEFHTHTDKSNLSNRDSTNFVDKLIDKAIELDLKGLAITDHASLSSHIDAILHMKKLRNDIKKDLESDPCNNSLIEKYSKLNEFKLCLGTEIYLVDRNVINEARENNLPTKFYHLILVAKNKKGYRAIAKLSSQSWEERFHHRGMERIPTYKDYFWEWAKENKDDVMVTSACLGSEFAQNVLLYISNKDEKVRAEIIDFLNKMKNVFGDNFYIELQPSIINEEQIAYNTMAIQIAKSMNIKMLINTDAHYLSKDKKEIHSIYLKSQNAERETEQFYSSTYLMDINELKEYFPYIDSKIFEECMKNSLDALETIDEFDLFRETEVPLTRIKYDRERQSILAPYVLYDIEKYNYILKFGLSEKEVDRTLLQQIELGLLDKKVNINEKVLLKINEELESLWEISEKLNQRLSNYYLLTKEIVEIMWLVSLVGVSRGSAGAFYLCYLLGITQINPIDFNLPSWRHISKERPELPDIDLDTEKGQRANILELIKQTYGYDKVLNICTFKTEGTASAIQTICRGMGIPTKEASYLSSLVVEDMTIKECLEAYKTNKEARTLIKEMMAYEGLIENVIEIEGLCCGRSSHASGVYIFNQPYWETNAMMKTPKGLPVTQYDMACSDYQGGLKLDFLTIESLDRIRKDLELLIEDGVIKREKSLRETYNKVLHPDILEYNNQKMWKMLCDGEILDAFQYDSPQGKNAISKIKPNTFKQLMDGNALMRLVCEGEQPIDRYVKFKENINLWYKEMREVGLNEVEIGVMRNHLDKSYGVAATQEAAMKLSMDKKIAGFSLVYANKLRKAIAKAYAKDTIKPLFEKWMEDGEALGNRKVFLIYVWKTCIEPMLG